MKKIVEDQFNEFKDNFPLDNSDESKSFREKIYKTIIAFSNTYGGHIYIGIDDNGNQLKNNFLENYDQISKNITDKIKNKYGIKFAPEINLCNKNIIEINIKENYEPIFEKDGSIYLRINTQIQKIPPNESIDIWKNKHDYRNFFNDKFKEELNIHINIIWKLNYLEFKKIKEKFNLLIDNLKKIKSNSLKYNYPNSSIFPMGLRCFFQENYLIIQIDFYQLVYINDSIDKAKYDELVTESLGHFCKIYSSSMNIKINEKLCIIDIYKTYNDTLVEKSKNDYIKFSNYNLYDQINNINNLISQNMLYKFAIDKCREVKRNFNNDEQIIKNWLLEKLNIN